METPIRTCTVRVPKNLSKRKREIVEELLDEFTASNEIPADEFFVIKERKDRTSRIYSVDIREVPDQPKIDAFLKQLLDNTDEPGITLIIR